MRPRYGKTLLAGGLLAGVLALVAPAAAENPMTPLRPAEPPKSADRAAASPGPATGIVRSVPAEAATPARPSIAADAAPAMPGAAPSSPPGDAAIAETGAAAAPRTRRGSRRDRAAGGFKPGRWEFTARLQTPAPASPAAAQAAALRAAAGGMQTTYIACVEADNAVPADLGPQCRLERHERRGSRISWSMSCSNTGVRSDGLANYRGDAMQATVVSHIPGAGDGVTAMTQHITGRYLGPCLPTTAAVMPATAPPAAAPQPPGTPAAEAQTARRAMTLPGPPPEAGATSAVAATTAATPPSTVSEPPPAGRLEKPRRHVRRGRHPHHTHRRHHGRSYRAWYGGASSFGPNPQSGAGP